MATKNNDEALNAFTDKIQIASGLLEALKSKIDNHAGVMPEDVTWADVSTVTFIINHLEIVLGMEK
jgi:hypothetical protein